MMSLPNIFIKQSLILRIIQLSFLIIYIFLPGLLFLIHSPFIIILLIFLLYTLIIPIIRLFHFLIK